MTPGRVTGETTPSAPEPWFPAEITSVTAGTPPTYAFKEKWIDGTKSLADVFGGRISSSLNPGVAVTGGPFAEGDIALARSARGAGGLLWELSPLAGTTCDDWRADRLTAGFPDGPTDAADGYIVCPLVGTQPPAGPYDPPQAVVGSSTVDLPWSKATIPAGESGDLRACVNVIHLIQEISVAGGADPAYGYGAVGATAVLAILILTDVASGAETSLVGHMRVCQSQFRTTEAALGVVPDQVQVYGDYYGANVGVGSTGLPFLALPYADDGGILIRGSLALNTKVDGTWAGSPADITVHWRLVVGWQVTTAAHPADPTAGTGFEHSLMVGYGRGLPSPGPTAVVWDKICTETTGPAVVVWCGTDACDPTPGDDLSAVFPPGCAFEGTYVGEYDAVNDWWEFLGAESGGDTLKIFKGGDRWFYLGAGLSDPVEMSSGGCDGGFHLSFPGGPWGGTCDFTVAIV